MISILEVLFCCSSFLVFMLFVFFGDYYFFKDFESFVFGFGHD